MSGWKILLEIIEIKCFHIEMNGKSETWKKSYASEQKVHNIANKRGDDLPFLSGRRPPHHKCKFPICFWYFPGSLWSKWYIFLSRIDLPTPIEQFRYVFVALRILFDRNDMFSQSEPMCLNEKTDRTYRNHRFSFAKRMGNLRIEWSFECIQKVHRHRKN